MYHHSKGQVIVPTGGGKTMCMINDAQSQFSGANDRQTIVVVARRILLAKQLASGPLKLSINSLKSSFVSTS